jgi:hypothetical protein
VEIGCFPGITDFPLVRGEKSPTPYARALKCVFACNKLVKSSSRTVFDGSLLVFQSKHTARVNMPFARM